MTLKPMPLPTGSIRQNRTEQPGRSHDGEKSQVAQSVQPQPDWVSFTMRHGKDVEDIQLPPSTTTKELSAKVYERLQIPIAKQRFLVPKYGCINMGNIGEHVSISVFAGKRVLLLGNPEAQTARLNASLSAAKRQQEQVEKFLRDSKRLHEELNEKIRRADEIAGTQPEASTLDPEDYYPEDDLDDILKNRRCWGRRCSKNRRTAVTTKDWASCLIATGVIPRAKCDSDHITFDYMACLPGKKGCQLCWDYFHSWYLFLCWSIDCRLAREEWLLNWGATRTAQVAAEHKASLAARELMKKNFVDGCLEEIYYLIDAMDIDHDQYWSANEVDRSDGYIEDIDSFWNMVFMLEEFQYSMSKDDESTDDVMDTD